MIYINWHQVWLIALPLTLAALFALLVWQTRSKPLWARILVTVFAVPLALVGLVFAVFFFIISITSPTANSGPIRSPDGRFVARAETWSGLFSTDGGTNVKVYSLRGLHSSRVYSGGEQSVEDVRWLDNHTLEVRYIFDEGHTCDSTRSVHILCLPADSH